MCVCVCVCVWKCICAIYLAEYDFSGMTVGQRSSPPVLTVPACRVVNLLQRKESGSTRTGSPATTSTPPPAEDVGEQPDPAVFEPEVTFVRLPTAVTHQGYLNFLESRDNGP